MKMLMLCLDTCTLFTSTTRFDTATSPLLWDVLCKIS
jgi:hypothetical protein